MWVFSTRLFLSIWTFCTHPHPHTGHGNLTPRTSEGKVVTMLYALIGVPLMLMCLSSLGGFLAEALQCSYGRLCGGGGGRGSKTHGRHDACDGDGSSAKRPNGCGVDVTRATMSGGVGGGGVHHHIKHNGGDAEVSALLAVFGLARRGTIMFLLICLL